jgi:hypothetical protein
MERAAVGGRGGLGDAAYEKENEAVVDNGHRYGYYGLVGPVTRGGGDKVEGSGLSLRRFSNRRKDVAKRGTAVCGVRTTV